MNPMNRDTIKKLYEEYELTENDAGIFDVKNKTGQVVKKVPMILRSGIEKIQDKLGALVTYEIIQMSEDQKSCVIKAVGEAMIGDDERRRVTRESYAEVSPENCKNKYPVMTCEKRALGRVILKLAGFYQHGIFAEGENLTDE